MARNKGKILTANNEKILNGIRNEASLDYQRRIPAATQANISETVNLLNTYRPLWNEFVDALVNRIGSVVARDITWSNPLSEFKRQTVEFGDTIEEVQTGLIESRVYSADREYLEGEIFGRHAIDVKSSFHTVNRQEYYPVTVNETILRRAFLEEGGLSNFVSQIMSAPTTSDQWDEFLLTCSLFREYEKNGGFYHVKVSDLRTLSATQDQSRQTLKRIRAMASTLTFLSTNYNAARMPVFARREDLVLFATPEFVANIDVEALAAAFNIERANVPSRVIEIPAENFGINGAQAVLTTRDFFMIADTRIENTSQYNPVSLSTNYFLHHHEIISASRFVPAVMFWTGDDDEKIVVKPDTVALTAIDFKNTSGSTVAEVVPGGNYEVVPTITGTNNLEIGIDYDVTGNKDNRTTIDNEGLLSVGPSETAASLSVTATVTYVNPATPKKSSPTVTKTVDVKVSSAQKDWPRS